MAYASVQGAFQYGVLAPLRRRPRDPAQLQQPLRQDREIKDDDHLAKGDEPQLSIDT